MINTLNSLQYALVFFSAVALILLHKRKNVFYPLLFIVFFSIIWRYLSRVHSTRYYIITILYGIALSAFFANKVFKNGKMLFLFILFLTGIILCHTAKAFFSFSDRYLLDMGEILNTISREPEPKDIYINKKEKRRLSGDPQEVSKEYHLIPEDSEEIGDFFIKYLFLPRKVYIVHNKSCRSEAESDNCVKIRSAQEVFLEKARFVTNSGHNRFFRIYALKEFEDSMDVKSEIALSPGGVINLTKDTIAVKNATKRDDNQIIISGIQSVMLSKYNILVFDNSIHSEVTVKNIGENPTKVLIGYAVYSKECIKLDSRNYPYKNNLFSSNIESIDTLNNSIIVDSLPDWDVNCFLAVNAMDDLSDIPNNTFAGKISGAEDLPDKHKRIMLDSPIGSLSVNDKVRIHGKTGSFLYTNIQTLPPNESVRLSATIKKDDNNISYSNKSLPKGTCYVKPILLSYSINSEKENTVLVENYTLSF